jgi:antagonist of KipI
VFANLCSAGYLVSDESNRAGLRLRQKNGMPLKADRAAQLVTEGVPLGAIQVPPDSQPIILLVDQQTTGGYPKIANVIAADLHRLGQLKPRDELCFAEVSIADAVALLREQRQWLENLLE